jgi:hypothetical protein
MHTVKPQSVTRPPWYQEKLARLERWSEYEGLFQHVGNLRNWTEWPVETV